MPRYFFHLTDGDDRLEDAEGVDLADRQAATRHALQVARHLLAEDVRNGEVDLGLVVETTDRRGTVLDRVGIGRALHAQR